MELKKTEKLSSAERRLGELVDELAKEGVLLRVAYTLNEEGQEGTAAGVYGPVGHTPKLVGYRQGLMVRAVTEAYVNVVKRALSGGHDMHAQQLIEGFLVGQEADVALEGSSVSAFRASPVSVAEMQHALNRKIGGGQ